MRRLHLEKTRAGALFHLWITVDMEPQCWESRQEMGELPMESMQGVAYESDLIVVKMGIPREILSQEQPN